MLQHPSTLGLYFLLVAGVIALPGMDMAFVLGSAVAGGKRAGFMATAGIVTGGVVHLLMAATGLSVFIKLFPALFIAMLLGGGLYLLHIAVSLARASTLTMAVNEDTVQHTAHATFVRAMLTCLLNPKAWLFMLAVFPQFIELHSDAIWLQASMMGTITALTQCLIYGGIALLAGRARSALGEQPHWSGILQKAVALMLGGLALYTLWSGLHLILQSGASAA